jgi:hypothetical protein
MALLLLLLSDNKGITARALLIPLNRDTGTVRPLLRRTSTNSRREVVGMDNRRTDNRNRVPMEDSLNRVLTVSLLLSLFSSTVSHRLGVTDNLLGATDSLPPLRSVRLRFRRLTGKVQDNLQLLTGKDSLLLQLTEHL